MNPSGINIDRLAKQHFILNQQLDAAMGKFDFIGALSLRGQRDAVTSQLFKAGWDKFDLGANALGVEKKHFQELVAQGIYTLGLGCPELIAHSSLDAMKQPDIETLIAASLQHGQDSEPDHEVGDLQAYLRAGWGLLTTDQRMALLNHPRLKSALEATGEEALLVIEKLQHSEGGENLFDIFQEHGNDEGADAEISDLQDALRTCWDVLTSEQRAELLELDSVQETYENATMEPLFPVAETTGGPRG